MRAARNSSTFFPAIGHLEFRLLGFDMEGRALDLEEGDGRSRRLHVDEAAILEAVDDQVLDHIRVLTCCQHFRYLLVELRIRQFQLIIWTGELPGLHPAIAVVRAHNLSDVLSQF